MKLATGEEMREVDKRAREEYGLSELVLMENAGSFAARTLADCLGGIGGKSLVIVAGSGNNGGDALVAARHLSCLGARVKVFLAGEREHLKESPAAVLHTLERMGIDISSLDSDRDFDRLRLALRFAGGVVDGILGTGFQGELRKKTLRILESINESHAFVLSLDIPSGVNGDTGDVETLAIHADATVTFGVPKPGHFLAAGARSTGKLFVDSIGLPPSLLSSDDIKQSLIDDELALEILPQRDWAAHKGTCGNLLVVAGSRGMTGAAALSSMAALRAGAGLVTLAVPESLQELLAAKLTEVMTLPLPEEANLAGRPAGLHAIETLQKSAGHYDAMLLGPGLGRAPETLELVRIVAKEAPCPVVLDADAIFAFRGHLGDFQDFRKVPILTPHLGEMAGLLGLSAAEIRKDLVGTVRRAAQDLQAIFVMKSECTLVAYPDGDVFFTTKGNAGMATAGSGDVLAGTVLGLLKQMKEMALAPLLGVYLHGLAGDLAYEEQGDGLVAGDILASLGRARRTLMDRKAAFVHSK